MDCQQYMAKLSELIDGRVEESVSRDMDVHRSACAGCRRYSDILESGRRILKSLPALEVPGDFRARLDHRILHIEDGSSLSRQGLSTGATIASVLSVAVVLAAAAWAPALAFRSPTVELPPVVVAEPSPPDFTRTPSRPTFSRNLSVFSTIEFQEGIWGDSHDLLREYSPILDRRREQSLIRVGIE